MSYLIDSCILIDHLRGHEVATRFLVAAQAPAISQVTWIEIMVGANDDHEATTLRALLTAFTLLPLDDRVAEEAVRLRRARKLKLPDASEGFDRATEALLAGSDGLPTGTSGRSRRDETSFSDALGLKPGATQGEGPPLWACEGVSRSARAASRVPSRAGSRRRRLPPG